MPDYLSSLVGGSASGLVGGLLNMGSTALQNKYNRELAAQQNQYNREMAALQNEYNIANWNMQNEYNSPSAQMSRLAAAGLNPNLAYGSVSSGNASSAPESVSPHLNAPERKAMDFAALAPTLEGVQQVVGILQGLANVELTRKKSEGQDFQNKIFGAQEGALHAYDQYEDFSFDPSTGSIHFASLPSNEVNVVKYGANYYRLANAIKLQNMVNKTLNTQAGTAVLGHRDVLLQKDIDWYDTDVISNIVFKALGTLSNFIPKVSSGHFTKAIEHNYRFTH